MILRHVGRHRRLGRSIMAASALVATVALPMTPAFGATKSLVGNYAGTTSPVWINGITTPVHRATTMNLSIVNVSYGSCGGPIKSRVTVLCLTSGNVDDAGDVANWYNTAPWSMRPYVACKGVESAWQPAYRIPPSGIISLHYTLMRDPGTALATPIEKVATTIHISPGGSITGSLPVQVYTSGLVTGQKWAPYCSSGSVNFHLHRV